MKLLTRQIHLGPDFLPFAVTNRCPTPKRLYRAKTFFTIYRVEPVPSQSALGLTKLSTDAFNNTTSFVYDADGQLTPAADPLGDTASFAYDKNGNRNSVTDPLQNVTTYTYDYRGRPTQKVDALGKITAFSYVATGCQSCGGGGEKLTSLTDAAGSTTSFAYDLRGLLTSEIKGSALKLENL